MRNFLILSVILSYLNNSNAGISYLRSSDEEPDETVKLLRQEKFPEDFKFAVGTAAYQIEGGWNANGKGESIWDRFTHEQPHRILDSSNGDIACDSYHKYEEDVQMMKNLGVNAYRFSLSWTRILPTGYNNVINQDGINYYHKLIDELLKNGIEPFVTIYHWDLPQSLQEIGGWTNDLIPDLLVDLADIAFKEFGDKVKIWVTINEPRQICKMGYGDGWIAPSRNSPGIGDYLCTKNVLLAHARMYHLYHDKYAAQGGKIAPAMDNFWFQPISPDDEEAAHRVFDFYTGIYANPIFGSGDFPESVKKFVSARSAKQHFASSRLPTLTEEEINLIKGTYDFFGLNFYTSVIVNDAEESPVDLSIVSWNSDMGADYDWDPEWERATSWWLRVTPWNLPFVLRDLKRRYGDIDIYITENGLSDHENKNDIQRANYHLNHLNACLEAIADGVKLKMYTAWSLMDNFEWTHGYTNRFGLYHVDFNDPERKRTPKLSAEVYKQVLADRKLPNTTISTKGASNTIKISFGLITISVILNKLF
nr:cytosolic beta-glucosidase-like [Onthophagus taurus]